MGWKCTNANAGRLFHIKLTVFLSLCVYRSYSVIQMAITTMLCMTSDTRKMQHSASVS